MGKVHYSYDTNLIFIPTWSELGLDMKWTMQAQLNREHMCPLFRDDNGSRREQGKLSIHIPTLKSNLPFSSKESRGWGSDVFNRESFCHTYLNYYFPFNKWITSLGGKMQKFTTTLNQKSKFHKTNEIQSIYKLNLSNEISKIVSLKSTKNTNL